MLLHFTAVSIRKNNLLIHSVKAIDGLWAIEDVLTGKLYFVALVILRVVTER